MKLAVASLLLLALTACPPTPAVPPPDASDAAPQATCAAACSALAAPAVACPIGAAASCPAFLTQLSSSGQYAPYDAGPVTCAEIAAVKTSADARRLGFTCGPVAAP
jgi:hypothetical protein